MLATKVLAGAEKGYDREKDILEVMILGGLYMLNPAQDGDKKDISKVLKKLLYRKDWPARYLHDSSKLEQDRILRLVRTLILFKLHCLNNGLEQAFSSQELALIRNRVDELYREISAGTWQELVQSLNEYAGNAPRIINDGQALFHPDRYKMLHAFLVVTLWHMLNPELLLLRIDEVTKAPNLPFSPEALEYMESYYTGNKFRGPYLQHFISLYNFNLADEVRQGRAVQVH